MFFFAAYALLVWYAAARWRRRWESFAWVGAGIGGLVLLAWLHYCLNDWTHGRIYLRVLQVLLYPYTAMVGLVGFYICCLPTRVPESLCANCRYDLAGLEEVGFLCPECGRRPESQPVSRGAAARPSPAAAPLQAGPRWPAIGSPATCHHSADG